MDLNAHGSGHWEIISPDLSGKKADSENCETPDLAEARDCGYGVVYSIAPSLVLQLL